MPRYAEHECDDCGVVLPSNQLFRIQDRVLSSVSQSTRLYRGTRGGLGVGGSSRQTFKIQQLEVCPDCHQDRVDRARRAAFGRLVQAIAVAAVIVLVVVGIATSPKSATTVVSNDTTPAIADNSSVPINVAEPIATASPSDAPTPVVAPPPEPISQTIADDNPRTGQDTAPRQTDSAVDRATQTALTSGHAEPWAANGDHGFVTVSSAQEYPDRVCRNAYSTLNSRGDERRSDSVLWCQSKVGGEWSPAN